MLDFPANEFPAWLGTPGCAASGLALRPAGADDLPFLRDLYAASRAQELAGAPWPDDAKRAFCDSQFDLQHRHYLAHCTPGAFAIILRDDRAIGRLYLHWSASELHIVDLLLHTHARGQGVGSTLLRWLQSLTSFTATASLALHVEQHNEVAMRLYRRMGFTASGIYGSHVRMAWSPSAARVS